MSARRRRSITCVVGAGGKGGPTGTFDVVPVWRRRVWAVHDDQMFATVRGVNVGSHTVTHIPSGRRVFVGSEDDALGVARELAKKVPDFGADTDRDNPPSGTPLTSIINAYLEQS